MLLNDELLSDCEEFFDQIPNEKNNVKLDHAMNSLRNLLEEQIDGWTRFSEDVFARAVQCRLMEIWSLVSRAEKAADPDLQEYYEKILESLEDVSGYESDDDETFADEED